MGPQSGKITCLDTHASNCTPGNIALLLTPASQPNHHPSFSSKGGQVALPTCGEAELAYYACISSPCSWFCSRLGPYSLSHKTGLFFQAQKPIVVTIHWALSFPYFFPFNMHGDLAWLSIPIFLIKAKEDHSS